MCVCNIYNVCMCAHTHRWNIYIFLLLFFFFSKKIKTQLFFILYFLFSSSPVFSFFYLSISASHTKDKQNSFCHLCFINLLSFHFLTNFSFPNQNTLGCCKLLCNLFLQSSLIRMILFQVIFYLSKAHASK